MPTYRVPLDAAITCWVTVEANDPEEAAEKAYQNIPGIMTTSHEFPDVGEWEVPDFFYTEAEPIK